MGGTGVLAGNTGVLLPGATGVVWDSSSQSVRSRKRRRAFRLTKRCYKTAISYAIIKSSCTWLQSALPAAIIGNSHTCRRAVAHHSSLLANFACHTLHSTWVPGLASFCTGPGMMHSWGVNAKQLDIHHVERISYCGSAASCKLDTQSFAVT